MAGQDTADMRTGGADWRATQRDLPANIYVQDTSSHKYVHLVTATLAVPEAMTSTSSAAKSQSLQKAP
eukprot:365229-Chlamydomonas_euryale.AAC.3